MTSEAASQEVFQAVLPPQKMPERWAFLLCQAAAKSATQLFLLNNIRFSAVCRAGNGSYVAVSDIRPTQRHSCFRSEFWAVSPVSPFRFATLPENTAMSLCLYKGSALCGAAPHSRPLPGGETAYV